MLISKKGITFVLALLTVFAVNFNAGAADVDQSEDGFTFAKAAGKVLWYIPNCLLDLVDCFSVEAGAGDIGVDVNLTRYASFGAGIGNSYNVGWSHHRQIGFFNDNAYNANLVALSVFDKTRKNILGTHESYSCFNHTRADIINYPDTLKHEDPWAIGAKIAFYLGVKVEFHPLELVDFVTGLFFYDLQDDDVQRKKK